MPSFTMSGFTAQSHTDPSIPTRWVSDTDSHISILHSRSAIAIGYFVVVDARLHRTHDYGARPPDAGAIGYFSTLAAAIAAAKQHAAANLTVTP